MQHTDVRLGRGGPEAWLIPAFVFFSGGEFFHSDEDRHTTLANRGRWSRFGVHRQHARSTLSLCSNLSSWFLNKNIVFTSTAIHDNAIRFWSDVPIELIL